jgi:hypothetical protein
MIIRKIEIVRLENENEIVISEIIFGMVHGWPYEGFQKIPHIPIPITHHWNLFRKDLPLLIII